MRSTVVCCVLVACAGLWGPEMVHAAESASKLPVDATVAEIVTKYGSSEAARIRAGVRRVAARWTAADGSAEEFAEFCRKHYVADPNQRKEMLARLETVLTTTHGHIYEIRRTAGQWTEFAGQTIEGVDELLAGFDPAPDLSEQLYTQKVAFLLLLNFETPTLEAMQRDGRHWSLDQWVAARLTRGLPPRIPAEVQNQLRQASTAATHWVYSMHPHVGTIVTADGKRFYESGTTLLPHWKVRDESIQAYEKPDGLVRQRALMWCMRRAIDGTLPSVLLEKEPLGDWDPKANTIGGRPVDETIGLVRYEHWLDVFHAEQLLDPYYPEFPSVLARSWELDREVPIERVERVLTDLLRSPVRKRLYALTQDRLGRPLEPHDVYYTQPFKHAPAEKLDALVAARFKDIPDFGRQLPSILKAAGFSTDDADWIAERIRVERSRDAGHCTPPQLPEYGPWLTTSLNRGRFDSGAFGTAMHELGHAVESTVSVGRAVRPSLKGVPGSCAVEAVANIFCDTRFDLIGVKFSTEDIPPLDQFTIESMLSCCQMAGPGLLEIRVWKWMYAHPDATPAALRDAVLQIATDIWTEFYEPYFGPSEYYLPAAYQHMIAYPLYLANYVLSDVALQQMRAYVRGKDVAAELMRMYLLGRLTPDLWMERAVGAPLSAEPLLRDTDRVLTQLGYGG